MKNTLHILFFSSIGQKTVMAASGIALGLFVIIHLTGNATVFMGREAFLAYAAHLHSLGALIPILELFLLSIFLLHVSMGMTRYLQNLKARPTPYQIKKEAGPRTLGSKTMPFSGLVILSFLVVHLGNFHSPAEGVTIVDLIRRHFHQPGTTLFYTLGALALALHLSHGFWSLFQSLGVNHPRYDQTLRNGAYFFSLTCGGIVILIPALVFFVDGFLL